MSFYRFEKQLKAKLSQKSNQFQSDEATLAKAFKYFDLNNDGTNFILFSKDIRYRHM